MKRAEKMSPRPGGHYKKGVPLPIGEPVQPLQPPACPRWGDRAPGLEEGSCEPELGKQRMI